MNLYPSEPVINEVRSAFYRLSINSNDTEKELEKIKKIKNPCPVTLAYQAAMESLMAKSVWSPFTKLEHVKESQRIFDKAIASDPDNVEIRFLRFSVEWHIPKWLGYSKNMEKDKEFIVDNIHSLQVEYLPKEMLTFIQDFLNNSEWYSDEELAVITKVIER